MLYIYLQIRFALAHEVIILPIDVCVVFKCAAHHLTYNNTQ